MQAFELAERLGGMTAFELMDRMTAKEMRYWAAFDRVRIDPETYRFAALMAKLDWHKTGKNSDMKRYLPKINRPSRSKTREEIRSNWIWAAAASGGMTPKGAQDGGQ
jgi:hypothetical protein